MSEVRIRRVVIGLADVAAAARDAIAAAADFARLLDVDLHALFIEDTLAFAAADLPHQRAIEPRALTWRTFDAAQFAQAHALAARAAERRLLDTAAGAGIAAVFQVVRGDPATALAQRLERSDLLVHAEPADPIARALPPYSHLMRGLQRTSAAVLYIPHRARLRAGPVVGFATSAQDPALDVAAALAAAARERLIALAIGGPATEQSVARAARERAAGAGVTLRVEASRTRSLPAAARIALDRYRERLMVVGRAVVAGDLEEFLELARARCAPLLVLPAGASAE